MERRVRASMKGSIVLAAVVTMLAGLMSGASGASSSNIIEVFPGPDAINNAMHVAQPGDTLSVHTGTYSENVLMSKTDITVRPAGDGPVTVDGGCKDSTFIVRADGSTIIGLQVVGGDFYAIDYVFVFDGTVSGNRIKNTCPAAEYGVNLFSDGPILVEGNSIHGFRDAGIYIGGILDTGTGTLIARRNDLYRNDRGIIVEDSVDVSILVRNNRAHHNFEDGIFLHNSDGIRITRNIVEDNASAGIELDDESDNNLVSGNLARGNVFDLANDGGTGNCFVNNTYTTSFGTIGC
jgi:parallel beta-helix repeat protein